MLMNPPLSHPRSLFLRAQFPAIFLSPICLATACCWVNGWNHRRIALLMWHLHFTSLPFQDSRAASLWASRELWMPAQVQHSLCCHYACHLSSPGCQQIFSGLTQIKQQCFCLVQSAFWTPCHYLPFFSEAITLSVPREQGNCFFMACPIFFRAIQATLTEYSSHWRAVAIAGWINLMY